MYFRKYYKTISSLEFDEKIHIHHINRNRKDNRIENLVHVDSLTHYRFHRNIDNIINIERTLIANNWTINQLKNSTWIKGFCLPYGPNKDWIKRLFKAEKIIIKNILIRNKRCKIEDIPILITDNQREIIEIYKNRV
jgi:hypothetical protein